VLGYHVLWQMKEGMIDSPEGNQLADSNTNLALFYGST
jgi:hypothetical protein